MRAKIYEAQEAFLIAKGIKILDRMKRTPDGKLMLLVIIDPAAAEQLIGHSQGVNIRTKRPKYVDRLSRAMTSDHWALNGEAIHLNDQMQVTNGQHRLHAIMLSKIPIRTYLFIGLEDAKTVDNNMTRQFSQYLQSQGHKNTSALAGAIRFLHRNEFGNLRDRSNVHVPQASFDDLIGVLARHKNLDRSVELAVQARNQIASSILAALHWLFSEKDPARADHFVSALASGSDIKKMDPILQLRNRLLEGRAPGRRMQVDHLLGLTIKAWNMARRGEHHRLTLNLSGKNAEVFPIIE